ncbi:MAG: exodeoxyribonuclease III [Muribaculaceae bacterium]|nr:exodeoxyribonuclease III [Muribaculaceae bacterium]
MKFVSWNVNGLRAVQNKGFNDIFTSFDADFFCLQETKLSAGQIDMAFDGYDSFWNYADKKGYSGTATFARIKPLSVTLGIGVDEHDHEGRVVTLELDDLYLVNVYTPNSQGELARLPYRMEWENAFLDYVKGLDQRKPVVICGDLNVAHEEIDLARPKANRHNAGFTDEERACFSRLLDSGFVDTFRHLHPDLKDAYSWWSYRFKAKEKNLGWRIDYFVISERLLPRLRSAEIHAEISGSDHCPVSLILD